MEKQTPQRYPKEQAFHADRPCLEVSHLYKSFEGKQAQFLALQDINLEVRAREFVTIAGPSGCGKSTLLNIIAGLEAPTSGKVCLEGKPIGGPGRDRGMIFQSYTLYPWLSVRQNVAFGLELRPVPEADKRERVNYFLDVVGLTAFADAYPKQLSGGMKQRVAIARALANEPEVLLMDEPFGALDAQTKEQMQLFILELWERTHTTILTITHDIEEAVFLGQRTYVMSAHPGRIRDRFEIPLPHPRDADLKLAPEFIEIKRQVLESLRSARAGGDRP